MFPDQGLYICARETQPVLHTLLEGQAARGPWESQVSSRFLYAGCQDAGCRSQCLQVVYKQHKCKIKPRDSSMCQGCWGCCFVLTPLNPVTSLLQVQPFFIFKNQDIPFPIAWEKNGLLLLQPKRHLPRNDFFPLIPFLPQSDSCLVDAVARTNVTARPGSLLVQFSWLKTLISPFFKEWICLDL